MTKNALIWGAAGGIGKAILEEFNAEGWTTVAVARGVEAIRSQANYAFEARLDDPFSVERAAYQISQEIEAIDLWIYAAGDILSAKVADLNPADWNRIMTANLSGAFYAYHYSRPLLVENAQVFFLGAVSERLRLPGLSAYAAAKAGLEAFVTTLSKEDRKKRFTVVRPGAVATPLWEKVPLRLPANAASPQKVAQKIFAAHVAGHKGPLDLV